MMGSTSRGNSIANSKEYKSFRNAVALKTIVVDVVNGEDRAWQVFDYGPRDVRTPILFLPPASGTADVFFSQILALGGQGYRVLGADYPPYMTHAEFADGFRKLLDTLRLERVHIVGASLGGFLAQKVAESEFRRHTKRVASLFLCNAFADTNAFKESRYAGMYHYLPSFVLKKILLESFPQEPVEARIADSLDFMVDKLDSMSQRQIASRLTLNTQIGYVEPQKLRDIPVTIMDVFDESAITSKVREEMSKCYPNARLAQLKSGGNFPFLSRPEEVNMHLKVHMRACAPDLVPPPAASVAGGENNDDGSAAGSYRADGPIMTLSGSLTSMPSEAQNMPPNGSRAASSTDAEGSVAPTPTPAAADTSRSNGAGDGESAQAAEDAKLAASAKPPADAGGHAKKGATTKKKKKKERQ